MDGTDNFVVVFYIYRIFLLAYINIFLHYIEKNLPVANEYQFHFYNEARSTKPRYSVMFTCSQSTCWTRSTEKFHSCVKSKQQCLSVLGKNMSENVQQRGVGQVKQRQRRLHKVYWCKE